MWSIKATFPCRTHGDGSVFYVWCAMDSSYDARQCCIYCPHFPYSSHSFFGRFPDLTRFLLTAQPGLCILAIHIFWQPFWFRNRLTADGVFSIPTSQGGRTLQWETTRIHNTVYKYNVSKIITKIFNQQMSLDLYFRLQTVPKVVMV